MLPRTEYIYNLAKLRLDLELWKKDQEFIEHGGQIYYAIDTDSITLYTNPVITSNYARVFPKEEKRTDEILAYALSEYIFNYLSKDKPLLIIPPYDIEIERVAFTVAHKAMNEEIRIPKIFERCKEKYNEKDKDKFINCLKEDPLDVIFSDTGGKESACSELKRIKDLLEKKRILHIERYKEGNWSFPVLDESNPKDYRLFKNLSKRWRDLLKSKKSKSKSEVNIETDARVLARLEWINREIKEEKKRLVLISGDESMVKAASEFQFNGGDFASLFIRIPRIYLAIPDFLHFEGENEKGLLQWIDVFFAEYGLKTQKYPYNLQELVNKKRKIKKDLDGELKKIRKKWEEFISYVGVSYIPHKQLEEKLINKESDLESLIKAKQRDTLHSFWSTITVASYSNLDIRNISLPLRGLPALRFTLPGIKQRIERIIRGLDKNTIKELVSNPKKVFREFTKIDESKYTAFIYFALAFAAIGRWYASIALAKYALYIADHEGKQCRLPEGHEPITGNEAAYLLAWATRHNVYVPRDLEKCKKLLGQAEERKEKAIGDKYDIRFKAESIIIDIIYHFFDIFTDKKIKNSKDVQSKDVQSKDVQSKDIQSKDIQSKDIQSKDIRSIEDCYNELIKLVEQANKENDELVRDIIKKQLYAYLFYLFLIRREKLDEQLSSDEITKYLTDFENILNGKEKKNYPKELVIKTCFTYPVYLCIKYYLSKHSSERKKFNNFYKNYKYKCKLMLYDGQLYSFLRDIIESNKIYK